MPVLVGETCYEGHMQQGFGDVQCRMFGGRIFSGAAGVWHASVAFGGTKVSCAEPAFVPGLGPGAGAGKIEMNKDQCGSVCQTGLATN